MNFVTIRQAAEALNVPELRVRRAAADGKLDALRVGNRTLVDLDTARERLTDIRERITIAEVTRLTGLTDSAVRRGIQEGWLPAEKGGKTYYFVRDEVLAAIRDRMHR
ncbi:MAG: excisionase family DNA-binding protein [Clostridia bacterium]|nr:excisionase family DNA-binding protein [Clostridia bacterium]